MKYNILFVVLFLNTYININSIIWINEELTFDCSFFYYHEGDINIGVVQELGCNITHYREHYHRIMAFLLAVDEINKKSKSSPQCYFGLYYAKNTLSSI